MSDPDYGGILMTSKASITVLRSREEVERLWQDPKYRPEGFQSSGATVRFVEAPGDRGTEIHVALQTGGSDGTVAGTIRKLRASVPLAKVKDELRHFKQQVETGVIARSEAAPEGEQLGRKFKKRPAQPLGADERRKVEV